MNSVPPPAATRRRDRRRLAKRNLFTKRLRFLLLGLKLIDALGPPAQKAMIALIQECVAQIWPDPALASAAQERSPQKYSSTQSVARRASPARTV